MAKLAPWQVKPIDAYIEICGVDANGISGPWFGPELDQLVKKIREAPPWRDLLTEWDLVRTVVWLVSQKTRSLPEDYIGLLTNAPDGEMLAIQAKEALIRFLESLPRPYHVYFPMVELPAIGRAELKLSEFVAIIDTSDIGDFDSRLLLDKNAELVAAMGGGVSPQLTRDARYLRFEISGYADGTLGSPVAASAVAQLKHFLFAGLARKVLEEIPSWQLKDVAPVAVIRPTVVARHVSLDEDERYSLAMPDELYRFLLRVRLNVAGLEYYDTSSTNGPGLLGGELRPPRTPEEIAQAIPSGLGRLIEFLAIPRDDPDAVRIKAAIEWWIDAVVSQNQTISFLQFCIGFEALLGDSVVDTKRPRERGITERLADRFAYLRGRTQTEREAYRKEFVGVYERRGVIVHQRETQLRRSDDADACHKAREMLFAAIADELNALLRARNPKPPLRA